MKIIINILEYYVCFGVFKGVIFFVTFCFYDNCVREILLFLSCGCGNRGLEMLIRCLNLCRGLDLSCFSLLSLLVFFLRLLGIVL